MENKDWQRRNVWVRAVLIAMQVIGATCTRESWDPFATQLDLWAQKAARLFLTSPAVLTLESHRSLLVYRPPDTNVVTDDDESKAAAEPDAEAPAPCPEANPDMTAPVLEPPHQAVRMKISRIAQNAATGRTSSREGNRPGEPGVLP